MLQKWGLGGLADSDDTVAAAATSTIVASAAHKKVPPPRFYFFNEKRHGVPYENDDQVILWLAKLLVHQAKWWALQLWFPDSVTLWEAPMWTEKYQEILRLNGECKQEQEY